VYIESERCAEPGEGKISGVGDGRTGCGASERDDTGEFSSL
jgi:hypothetical protein